MRAISEGADRVDHADFAAVVDRHYGFVAVGSSTQGGLRATAWLSADGEAWTAETLDEVAGGHATAVAVNRFGFVAIGTSTITVDGPGFAWFVPTGGAASAQEVGARVLDLVAAGDRFIGVGDCGPMADCPSFLVIGRPASASEPDPSTGLAGDLVGTLFGDANLEVGCAWLTDSTRKQWEILWPQGYQTGIQYGPTVMA